MQHAPLPPSGASIWCPCPGSITLGAGIVEDETPEQAEGTATHWVGQDMLEGMVERQKCGEQLLYINKTAPNGVIITEHMARCAMIYYRAVMDVAGKGYTLDLNVERKTLAGVIHEHCWGTPDAWLYIQETKTLYVWDYKHGYASVNAENNLQQTIYALNIADELRLVDTETNFVFRIVQPNCYDGQGAVREWKGVLSDLRPWRNKLHASANEALSFGASLHVGLHCHYCLARHICPSLQKAGAQFADYAATASPQLVTHQALAMELSVLDRAAEIIDYRREALQQEALNRINQQQTIPGYEKKQTWTNNAWIQPDDSVYALGDLLGVDFRTPMKPVTPHQAEKLLQDALIDPAVIKSYYGRKPKGEVLALYDNSTARRAFMGHNDD